MKKILQPNNCVSILLHQNDVLGYNLNMSKYLVVETHMHSAVEHQVLPSNGQQDAASADIWKHFVLADSDIVINFSR